MIHYDCIENEIKFEVYDINSFIEIFKFYKSTYHVLPFRKETVQDCYYDYNNNFYLNDFSYRLRHRYPYTAINFKLPGSCKNGIWSRHEYRFKLKNKQMDNEIVLINENPINDIVKKHLELSNLNKLENVLNIKITRTGFNIYSNNINPIGNKNFIGTLYFDQIKCMKTNNLYYECEFETCNPLMTLDMFIEVESMNKSINALGYKNSVASKFVRLRGLTLEKGLGEYRCL